jgi:hypothetical protein
MMIFSQVKNYGYVPSALPDARCFGEQAPQSASDITKALADVFARAPAEAPAVVEVAAAAASPSPLEPAAARAGQGPQTSFVAASTDAATASPGAAGSAGAADRAQVVPHQGVDALFAYLEK